MRLVSAAVLALVILIPLAGCSGIFGPTAQEPSTFAPGVSNERVTDAATLAAANRAILQNTSYTYVRNYTQRVDTEGYHYAVNHDTRVWVAADGSFLYHHRGVVTGGEHPSEHIDGVWANGSIAVTRTINVRNGSVTYTRYRPPEPYSAANATHNDVSRALHGALVTTTWNESGTAYRRVHANTSETRRRLGRLVTLGSIFTPSFSEPAICKCAEWASAAVPESPSGEEVQEEPGLQVLLRDTLTRNAL